ncbi:MAG: hypothetical protein M1822_008622 [Bathelium mastoideum]|nr:MAG: hypothetical protein M1822_008622 [Bathelium mastoideum]
MNSFSQVRPTTPSEVRLTEPTNTLRVLVASTNPPNLAFTTQIIQHLNQQPNISLQAIVDPLTCKSVPLLDSSALCPTFPNCSRHQSFRHSQIPGFHGDNLQLQSKAAELCEWSNFLVLAAFDADSLARLLQGFTDSLLLEVLRSWNVSKKIVLVPGMSNLMWENPMTRKQLSKIRRKWNWIRVLSPVLWSFEGGRRKITASDGVEELYEVVQNQIDLITIGQGIDIGVSRNPLTELSSPPAFTARQPFPPEILTMILDFTGDWELAQALHVYTNLPTPPEWHRHADVSKHYMQDLEWTILTGTLSDLKRFFETRSVPRWFSKLCIRLIMRFAKVAVLAYLETQHRDLFWATFGHTFLPDKASSVFGQTALLEYWRTSPSFLTKEYTVEAVDGASRQGFVHVLDWWHRRSGLPLKYTEAALEQASSKGRLDVLDWWKHATSPAPPPPSASASSSLASSAPTLRLLPGKSICFAAQAGHAAALAWWLDSGLPVPHTGDVARLASAHGHVHLLDLWLRRQPGYFQGMPIDNQVLVGATKAGHVEVLEWWARLARGEMVVGGGADSGSGKGDGGAGREGLAGLRVEYKTCDVEEALEDGVEGERGEEVRRWWARNGLNLGLGTSEWMKTKVLS